MREIKFRGLTKNNGWVYGYLCADFEIRTYGGGIHIVISKTVGQYTGMKDRNGKEIYEGDCLGHPLNAVEYLGDGFCINGDRPLGHMAHGHEVVGNIHENPDLLKGE